MMISKKKVQKSLLRSGSYFHRLVAVPAVNRMLTKMRMVLKSKVASQLIRGIILERILSQDK